MDFPHIANMQEIHTAGAAMVRQSDDILIVRFYKKPVHNPRKSKEAGRHMYDPVDYVYIQQPGERDNTDRPVHDGDKYRFPRQWAQYQKNVDQHPEGTPLNVLFVEPNEVAIPPYLNGMGIYTVEQLESLSANAIGNVGLGGQDWVNKAKGFLEYASKGRGFHKLEMRAREAEGKVQVMEQQVAAMKAQLDQLMAERYSQTNFPTPRRHSEASINQRQFMVPDVPPPENEVLNDVDGLNAGGMPNINDLEAPRRRGRPPKQTPDAA